MFLEVQFAPPTINGTDVHLSLPNKPTVKEDVQHEAHHNAKETLPLPNLQRSTSMPPSYNQVKDLPVETDPGGNFTASVHGDAGLPSPCSAMQHRRQLMTAEVLLGSGEVSVAPVAVHLVSEMHLQLLQLFSRSRTAILAGDQDFTQCVPSPLLTT